MPVNQYFQDGYTPGENSEQELISDLVTECIKMYGFDVIYLPRQSVNIDSVMNEDRLNKYDIGYTCEMYLQSVDGFEGEGSLLSKFGIEIRDTATFIVAKKRWHELVAADGKTQLQTRPTTGDIIYFPLTKAFLEIREVKTKNPFFQVGKLYVYSMSCELMQFSSERFTTGYEEIDLAASSRSMDVIQSGEAPDEFSVSDRDPQAQNEQIQRQVKEVLFSKKNPFGDPTGID